MDQEWNQLVNATLAEIEPDEDARGALRQRLSEAGELGFLYSA